MTTPTVFLATDYGLDDEFVGVVHAVIAKVAPEVRVIDLAHRIAPFDVRAGAALLERAAPHLGEGVICAVVDPGVGGVRRAVAIEVGGTGPRFLVGPDNGLLLAAAHVLGPIMRAVELATGDAREWFAPASSTFDGRDLFAPAAAALATGTALRAIGASIDPASLVELDDDMPVVRALPDGRASISVSVRWIDRFGNLQLALPGRVLDGAVTAGVVVGDDDALVRVVRTYDELAEGTAGLLRDANDAVALVVATASAAETFGVRVGDRVELVGFFGPLT